MNALETLTNITIGTFVNDVYDSYYEYEFFDEYEYTEKHPDVKDPQPRIVFTETEYFTNGDYKEYEYSVIFKSKDLYDNLKSLLTTYGCKGLGGFTISDIFDLELFPNQNLVLIKEQLLKGLDSYLIVLSDKSEWKDTKIALKENQPLEDDTKLITW